MPYLFAFMFGYRFPKTTLLLLLLLASAVMNPGLILMWLLR